MIVRIVWVGIVLVLALITTGVQLDRQARYSAPFATMVPEPFRAFAQARIASNAVVSEDTVQGLAEAERLVVRRPYPAEHLRLLATAQFEAEQTEASGVTVQLAARRGWRDTLAQQAMLELALAAGDDAEAARRYAALLLNSETQNELLTELGTRTFSQPQGAARITLAEIVAGGDRWHEYFLRRGVRVLPADAFAEIVTTAHQTTHFDCPMIDQTVTQMRNRDPATAEQLADVFAETC